MASYPTRGLTPWDNELKAYVDEEIVTPDRVAATLDQEPVRAALVEVVSESDLDVPDLAAIFQNGLI